MDDALLAAALRDALVLERGARRHWQTAETHAERTAALEVVRTVTPVIKSLENWIAERHAATVDARPAMGEARR